MKKYVLLLIFVVTSLSVFSQKKGEKNSKKKDSIVEIVSIVTSYTPTIDDAFKIKKNPRIELSKNSKKKQLTYSIFSAPVASTFIPKSGVVKGIDVGKKERLFDNYLALGYGNYSTPYIESFLRQNKKFEHDYGLYLKYISSEGGIDETPLNNKFSKLDVHAYYMKQERYFTWKIGGNVEQQNYNWFGLPNISFDDQSIQSIQEEQNYGLYMLEGELIFDDAIVDHIKTSIHYFKDSFESHEIGFSLKPNFTVPLNFIGKNSTNLKFHTHFEYLQGEFEQNYLNETNLNYSFFNLELHPVTKLSWNKFNFKLGTKVFLSSDIENKLTDILVYPDLQISHPLISDMLNLYAGAGGDLHMNSFQSLSAKNPYVSPTLFLTQTNEQYNVFGGVQGRFSSDVSFNINASYQRDEDHVLFVRNNSKSNGIFDPNTQLLGYEYGNSFNVFYDDIRTLSIFGEVEIDLNKRFLLGGNFQYNSYTTTFQQAAWNLPKIEATLFGEYKKDKWYASSNIFLVGNRQDVLFNGAFPSTIAGIQTLDAYLDVNINGGYHFNDFFTGFLKLNNLLGTNYERYANFNVQGFQILAGVTYKFDF